MSAAPPESILWQRREVGAAAWPDFHEDGGFNETAVLQPVRAAVALNASPGKR